MYNYILGKVEEIDSSSITLDNNGIGYLIYVASPFSFNLGETYKVYIYQHITEDSNSLFGFKTVEEKELFLKLISVKGVGPKMTLPMLALGSPSGIIDAINRENILYLKKFPKIGDKVAKQIILDLKGKITTDEVIMDTSDELLEALKALGYKDKDVKGIIPKVNKENKIEEQIKEALKLLIR